jgi:RNA polymerase sigma-70 factor (ECF subfamily)
MTRGCSLAVNGPNDPAAPCVRPARLPPWEGRREVVRSRAWAAGGSSAEPIDLDPEPTAPRRALAAVSAILMPTRRSVEMTDHVRRAAEGRKPVDAAIVALVPRAAAGDEAAFTRLVEEFHADMARLAYFICGGNRELAEDAVQSAWTIAWSRLSTLRYHQRIRAWLLSVTANEARQAMRKQRRVEVFGIEFAEERIGAPGPYPSAIALDMADVLARLKPEERTLVGLRYAAGLDSAEIGTVLGMSASGVRSRLNRLLDRLRAELGQ